MRGWEDGRMGRKEKEKREERSKAKEKREEKKRSDRIWGKREVHFVIFSVVGISLFA